MSRLHLPTGRPKLTARCGAVLALIPILLVMTGCVPIEGVLPSSEIAVNEPQEIVPVTVNVNPTLRPVVDSLTGFGGGPPRPVGAVVEPDGTRYDFVANEIILKVASQAELDAFVARYGATVLRDGTDSGGYHLLRIDPSRSSLSDIGAALAAYSFSSEEAARTMALALREAGAGAEINELNHLQASLEAPFGRDENGNILYEDAEKFLEFQEDSDPNKEGDQGYSVGVTHAWDYVDYLGFRARPGTFFLPIIAIVDDGFALDPVTGVPLNGNLDYNTLGRPLQKDFAEDDDFAGGASDLGVQPRDKWHGQNSFSVAAAYPKNLFGAAGTGGHFVRPMLLRAKDADSDARAIRYATDNGANIISNSYTHNKRNSSVADAIQYARSKGVVVLAAAGNGVKDPDTKVTTLQDTGLVDIFPCEFDGVICVGGIDLGLRNEFNYGAGVDIWSPNATWTTSNPDTSPNTAGFINMEVYSGTSAATPFVAGIVGMMMVARPDIQEAEILSVLQSTANVSEDPLVARGWVDAYRAVVAVQPNRLPSVQIIQPVDDQTIGWQATPLFKCTYVDPEIDPTDVVRTNVYHGVVVFSTLEDGELCRAESPPYNCTATKPLSLGSHRLRGEATDPFGARTAEQITVHVVNRAPEPDILKPLATDALFSHIPVFFNGFVPDPDELILDENVTWTSSLDGVLGTGHQLTTSLSAGTHTITLTAVDGKGLSAADQVNINVVPGAGLPVPVITKPEITGLVFGPGQLITLEGSATDPEDGVLPGTKLEWSSHVDGVLGTGNSIQITLSAQPDPCNQSPHVITLKATDSDGHEVTVTILIYIGTFC